MKAKLFTTLKILLILLPAVVFYYLFFVYTVDVPVNDDYKAILEFLNKYVSTESRTEKIKLMFAQHNEHRIFYDRLWTLLYFKISGVINFNFLALIGNLSIIGIFAVFWLKAREIKRDLLYFIPLSVLLFNITFAENMTFAMATMSNITVHLFSLLSVYFITKDTLTERNFILSVVFSILGVLTMGSALFLIPVLIGILYFRKERKYLILYSIIALIVLVLYFYGFETPQHNPKLIDTFIAFKMRALLFSFAFLGNALNYFRIFTNDTNESFIFTAIAGFIFFCLYVYIVKTKYYKKNLFVFSVLTLIVLTAFISGVTRCQFGLETAGASRYRINGAIFLAALYLWFIETNKLKARTLNYSIIISSLLYFIFINVSQYEYLSYRKRANLLGVLNYHSGDYTKLNGFEQELYKDILVQSRQFKTYFLPSFASLESYFPYSEKKAEQEFSLNPADVTFSIDGQTKLKDSYFVNGYMFIHGNSANGQKVFFGLMAQDKKVNYFSTVPEQRFDLNPYFKKLNLQNGGFNARIRFTDVHKGTYMIVLKVIAKDGETRTVKTDKTIEFL